MLRCCLPRWLATESEGLNGYLLGAGACVLILSGLVVVQVLSGPKIGSSNGVTLSPRELMDLFDSESVDESQACLLSMRRPSSFVCMTTLAEVVGQSHLLGRGLRYGALSECERWGLCFLRGPVGTSGYERRLPT